MTVAEFSGVPRANDRTRAADAERRLASLADATYQSGPVLRIDSAARTK